MTVLLWDMRWESCRRRLRWRCLRVSHCERMVELGVVVPVDWDAARRYCPALFSNYATEGTYGTRNFWMRSELSLALPSVAGAGAKSGHISYR